MGNTLKEVLETLEKVGQAQEATPTTLASAPVETPVDEDTELRKLAEEYDAAGRIMAFAFADELQKIAVGVTGITPNTAEVPENPAVQLSDGYPQLDNVEKVVGQLRAITQGAEAKMSPAGKVESLTPSTSGVMPTTPSVQVEHPTAYDAAKAQEQAHAEASVSVSGEKQASAAVEVLYGYFFGNN